MKLSSKQRKRLPDTDFGLITDSGERKYPMHDKQHVLLAIRMFKYCPKGKEKELASKINSKMKEFGIKINPSKGGAFTKYAASESLTCSKEASNVGTLEPIVGGSETLKPMSHADYWQLDIPDGQKKMIAYLNGDLEETEEAAHAHLSSINQFDDSDGSIEGIKPRYYDKTKVGQPISLLNDFDQKVHDIIALGEYNDAIDYTLDHRTVYGLDSWMYKDQIEEIYNEEYDEEFKVIDLCFIISSCDSDTRKYLLSVLYTLDSTKGYGLLSKVLDNLADEKIQFKSFITPGAPNSNFGPFDQESPEYDYPEKHNFNFEFITRAPSFACKLYFIQLICNKYGIFEEKVSRYIQRMLGAELVNRKLIDGYDASDYTSENLLVRKGDMYGFAVLEGYVIHFFYFPKEIWGILCGVSIYGSQEENIARLSKYLDKALHIEYDLPKSYGVQDEIYNFSNSFSWTFDFLDQIEKIYNWGLDCLENHKIDDTKDALASLFTACRVVCANNEIRPTDRTTCKYRCKNLLQKIYALESKFNFMKFYEESGYDLYVEGMNAQSPKLTYNFVMGI